jgi:hypothetical protein
VALMDAASKATAQVRAGLADHLNRNLDHAEDSAAVMLDRMARMEHDLVSQAEEVRGKRPRRALQGVRRRAPGAPVPGRAAPLPNPPSSNRGVKSTGKGTRRATETGRSAGRRGAKK